MSKSYTVSDMGRLLDRLTNGQALSFRITIEPESTEPRSDVARITEKVAQHFGLSTEAITNHDRRPLPVQARHVVMYLARRLTSLSYPEIGRELNRNHTTVLHGVTTTEAQLGDTPELARLLEHLKREILR